jgi:hypothetical protein
MDEGGTLVMIEIASKPVVGQKRMIFFSDVKAKVNADEQGGTEHGIIPNLDTQPVSEAGKTHY